MHFKGPAWGPIGFICFLITSYFYAHKILFGARFFFLLFPNCGMKKERKMQYSFPPDRNNPQRETYSKKGIDLNLQMFLRVQLAAP